MSKFIYMAGLIDGEGTIGISRDTNRKSRAPYISITSTTREIMEWLQENFGGTICVQKVYQPHHKPSWSWRLRNKSAVFSLIAMIEPYMLEPAKKARINLLLKEYDSVTKRNGKYTLQQQLDKDDFERRFLDIK